MNSKRYIFIILLVVISGASALLFAKTRLDKGTRYLLYARRGEVTALTHSPNQGRIVLTSVDSDVTIFPVRGAATKMDLRTFMANWPEFDPKGSITFQDKEMDTHLELTLTKPYYDRARQLVSFDVQAKTSLIPYMDIYEVNLYIYE